ncbi:GFA family protein [Caulobacter mirabilis]|uniref:CENP-V/GFA domain-containing protein n=1 Tax=Caulobacter mirabilis TaxID=69666 RepID=A0A2D2AYE6_9CAUL|nr:GFA family protein [Caulobacter mirabilis]ATQ43040.1 hypothetical protein CSW64_11775 [Caulobacter mirabilis]
MAIEGGCYCGNIRFKAEGDPMMKGQCHCRECQHITGGGPNYFLAMPAAGFAYVKGEPKQFARADLETPVTRDFCPDCGTPLLTRPQGLPAVIVKAGTLDDPARDYGGPLVAIWTSEKQPFHDIADGMASFPGFPGR